MSSYLLSIMTFLYVMHVVKNLNEPQRRRASQVLSIHQIADIANWMEKSKSEPWKVTEQDQQGFKTTYMNNVDLKNLNCFAINFGWSVQIDIPQVSLKRAMSKSISIPLKGSDSLSLKSFRQNITNFRCLIPKDKPPHL